MRTLGRAAAAVLALSIAEPAAAATRFNSEIHEGQYQTFTLQSDGPAAPKVWINGFDPLSYKDYLTGNVLVAYIYQVDKFCDLPLGTTSCTTGYVNVKATSWDNTLSLYIEFVGKSFDNCDKVESGYCASNLPPFFVTVYAPYDQGNFEVLSSGGGAVPEPATWAMMIMGFGLVGAFARRGRRSSISRQAA